MNQQEYESAVATLTKVDTEITALGQTMRDCIDRAREFNAATAAAKAKRTELEKSVAPLREQVQAYEIEQKRILAEQQKAKAEADAKAAAEAKAAEQSELEKAKARIAELEAAAKG